MSIRHRVSADPGVQQAHAIAAAGLATVLDALDLKFEIGAAPADEVVDLGKQLRSMMLRTPYGASALAAMALVEAAVLRGELAKAKADLAAVEDVAQDARSHWPTDAQPAPVPAAPTLAHVAGPYLVHVPDSHSAALRESIALDLDISRAHAAGDHTRCHAEQCPVAAGAALLTRLGADSSTANKAAHAAQAPGATFQGPEDHAESDCVLGAECTAPHLIDDEDRHGENLARWYANHEDPR